MPTRIITERVPWEDALGQVAYVADVLSISGRRGDKPVGAIAARLDPALSSWEPVDAQRRAARREQVRANAEVHECDVRADDFTRKLHNDLLSYVKQDRKDPLFQRFFPSGFGPVVRLGLENQLPAMKSILMKLDDPATPASIRKTHRAALVEIIADGEVAVAGRAKARQNVQHAGRAMAEWRDRANDCLLKVEGELKSLAADRRLGRGWVDDFFPPSPSPRKKAGRPEVEVAN